MTTKKSLVGYVSLAFDYNIFEELGREGLYGLVKTLKDMELLTENIFPIDELKALWTAAVLLKYNIKNPRLPNSIARLTQAHLKFCRDWKVEDLLESVESLEDFLLKELSEWVFRETAE